MLIQSYVCTPRLIMTKKTFCLLLLPLLLSNISCSGHKEAWINLTNANCVNAVAIEGNHIWAGTTGGVVKWNINDGDYVKYTTADGLADNIVLSIAIDSTGNKWFCTSEGISRFDGTNWATYTIDDGVADNVNSMAIDSEGNKWFGTNHGVSSFDGVNWTVYDKSDGLANDEVSSIAIDSEDNIWFAYGFNGNGVSKFDGTNWTTYTASDGLANDYVSSIAIDSEGNKWFGTFNYGDKCEVSKFDGINWTTYKTLGGLAPCVNSNAIDSRQYMVCYKWRCE